MTAPLESWKVLPHGQLTEVDDNVWTVTGTIHMPVGDFERRMTVVRLRDGGLVVYSAIALDEPQMARLDSLGRMAWLVVPGDDHRLDAKPWLQRYPTMYVAAPAGAREKALEALRKVHGGDWRGCRAERQRGLDGALIGVDTAGLARRRPACSR